MSTIGPKGPSDASANAKVLQFRRPTETATKVAPSTVEPTEPTSSSTPAPTPSTPAAVFDNNVGQTPQLVAPVEGAALSQLVARLKARGDQSVAWGDQNVVATAVSGPTVVQTDEGKVLSGSVQIESRSGLQKLDGIVRVGGSLAVEGLLKNADLLALRDLKVVEGRLTFEGLKQK
jgi:hypothetical protein